MMMRFKTLALAAAPSRPPLALAAGPDRAQAASPLAQVTGAPQGGEHDDRQFPQTDRGPDADRHADLKRPARSASNIRRACRC
jgi:hypothetical protein